MSPLFKNSSKLNALPWLSRLLPKIYEKPVYDQLYYYLNTNYLLSKCQSGFLSLHITLTALLEATNNWCVNIDNFLLNRVILIGLKKAFDTIDHEIVIPKLVKYGLDQNSVSWFITYLSSRSQQYSVNGHLFTASQITCGVPRSLIGPFLFLLRHINDLPISLNNGTARMSADDISISFAVPTN